MGWEKNIIELTTIRENYRYLLDRDTSKGNLYFENKLK